MYYWSSIRKLKANYHPSRGVQEDLVCKILQQHVIIEKDPIEAHSKLLELSGVAKYLRSLRTDDEKEHFERHLRKYVNIYLPDCPFEVDTTNRYTIMTAEACIKARKTIRKGEAIKYLSGIQVEMSEKEEKELSSRTDFSIVLSSRRKRPSLFLGPARFANHDCDSNAKLNTTGPHGIHIVARKDIQAGEEITVTYGDDYFGIENCECLCATCESLARNGWDPRGPVLHEDSSDDEDEEDVEADKPRRELKSESQSRSPSTLGKRKRIDDDSMTSRKAHVGAGEERVPRGRPRKNRCAGDHDRDALDSSISGSRHQERGDEESRHCRRRRPSDRELFDELAEVRRTSRGCILPPAEDSATPSGSQSPLDPQEWSPSPSPSSLLERIYNLLDSIGERKIKEEEERMKSKTVTPNPSTRKVNAIDLAALSAAEAPAQTASEAKAVQDVEAVSNLSDSPLSSVRTSPSYRRGLSRSPSKEVALPVQRNKSPEKSNLEVHRAKLQAIKKERSVSSLRNVVNAEDEDSLYSIPPSPLTSERAKEGHRSLQKEQPEHEPSDSTGSSSPSSNHDNFSATSQTSSMTSVESESFTAGNIASSICQLLTLDDGVGVVEEQHECSNPVEDAEAMDVDEPESSEHAPTRGRRQVRTSSRKVAPATSTPPVQSIETIQEDEASEDEEKRGEARTPGDYTLCSALLSTTYHRWIECRNCDEYFVQGDAYLTRIACPRCERHSKLYGYYWPKTDRESKFDREERVLDHRTIHRFIDPEEERSERKGRKTLADVVRERELSSTQESEEAESIDKRLRNSPRRSESRRKLRMTM